MFQQDAKPVTLIVIEPTRIDGKPIPEGAVLRDVPADLAMELAAAGKVRVATEELVEEYTARAKQAAKRAAEQSKAGDPATQANERLAATVAAAVATALQAAGVVPAAKAAEDKPADGKAS